MQGQIALIAENADVTLNERTQLKKASKSRHLVTATPSCSLRTCHGHIPYNGQLF